MSPGEVMLWAAACAVSVTSIVYIGVLVGAVVKSLRKRRRH